MSEIQIAVETEWRDRGEQGFSEGGKGTDRETREAPVTEVRDRIASARRRRVPQGESTMRTTPRDASPGV
jgi:hypothetical protein